MSGAEAALAIVGQVEFRPVLGGDLGGLHSVSPLDRISERLPVQTLNVDLRGGNVKQIVTNRANLF
jgi:hypothetical protein